MVYTQPIKMQVVDLPRAKEEPMYPISTEFPWDEFSSNLLDQLKEARSIEETGIPQEFLNGLALKILYLESVAKGWQVAQAMRLNFSSIVEPLLQDLKNQHLIQVLGGDHGNRASYRYGITEKGSIRARELLERSRYVGPCPVSLRRYVEVVKLQAKNRSVVNETDVRYAMQGLVLPDDILDRLGPAVNSFKSLFLYGPPGNGKTTLARATAHRLLAGNIMIPHAIYLSG